MAWIKKGKQEYYTTVRRGKTVKRIYLGKSQLAWGASRLLAYRREERLNAREAVRQEHQTYRDAITALEACRMLADGLLAASLLYTGYHRHAGGEWRKKLKPKPQGTQHGHGTDSRRPQPDSQSGPGGRCDLPPGPAEGPAGPSPAR